MIEFDKSFLNDDIKTIAGMDEVGRGPLAGPVCVACVIMPLNKELIIEGVNDSKKLSPKKREELDKQIKNVALDYQIVSIDSKKIDEINILNATKLAMKECIKNLKIKPDFVLVDYIPKPDFNFKYETFKKGDAKSYSIACASIIAKVYRDNLMVEMSKIYPEYDFQKHKGYGTATHIQKIKEFGPCKIHRETFIKNFKVN